MAIRAPPPRLGRVIVSCLALLDDPIRGQSGAPIGEVEDILLEAESGCIAYLVVRAPHEAGLFAVPWTAIRIDERNLELLTGTDEIRTAPGVVPFRRGSWPNFADAAFEGRDGENERGDDV